jgi:Na+/H+-translocating membrane pyrophosphatase
MRGGSLPVLAWGCLIGVLMAGNAIWEGRTVQSADYGFAVAVIFLTALAVVLAGREAIRRGPPPPAVGGAKPQRIPDLSFGAVGAAIAIGSVVFGLTFGHFLVYFGCGLFVLCAGRLALELLAARRGGRRR